MRYRHLIIQGLSITLNFAHLDIIFISHRNSNSIQQIKQNPLIMNKP